MSPTAAAVETTVAVAVVATAPTAASRVHCDLASHELRIQEERMEADAVLADEAWRWVRDLTDAMPDDAAKTQSKVFFLRLLRADDSAAVEAVLGEMETWREALQQEKKRSREERHGLQALFLLGIDKQMSLARCP